MHLLLPHYRYRKGICGPFEAVVQMEWCRHCQMEVDVEIDQGRYESVNVFRKRCLRCGRVTHWGIDRRALTSNVWSVMQAAIRWITLRRENRA